MSGLGAPGDGEQKGNGQAGGLLQRHVAPPGREHPSLWGQVPTGPRRALRRGLEPVPPPQSAAHLGMGQWAAVITHLGQTRKPPQKCCPSIWMEAMKGQEWGSAAFPPITRLPRAPGGCGC